MPSRPRQTVHNNGAATGLHSPPFIPQVLELTRPAIVNRRRPPEETPLDIKLDAGFGAFRAGEREILEGGWKDSRSACCGKPLRTTCFI